MVLDSETSESPSVAPPSTTCPPWSRRLSLGPFPKVSLASSHFTCNYSLFIGLPNIFWRVRKSFFTVVPPFIMSYLIFTETEKEHDRYNSVSVVYNCTEPEY